MINGRLILYRHLQDFFEREIFEQYRWHQVRHCDPELAAVPAGRRRNPLGRDRETARVLFDDYELEIASSEETPPLGRVTLMIAGREKIEGPIDPATWAKMGAYIRQHSQKAFDHV